MFESNRCNPFCTSPVYERRSKKTLADPNLVPVINIWCSSLINNSTFVSSLIFGVGTPKILFTLKNSSDWYELKADIPLFYLVIYIYNFVPSISTSKPFTLLYLQIFLHTWDHHQEFPSSVTSFALNKPSLEIPSLLNLKLEQ